MGINFPNSPTLNQLWPQPPVAGQAVYRWDGEKWLIGPVTGSAVMYTQDTAPTGVPAGSLWWNTTNGQMYVYYNDGNSTQWVFTSSSGPQNAVIYDAAQTLSVAQQLQARDNIAIQKKNYMLNGAMMVSTENFSSVGTISGYYPVDCFLVGFSNAGAVNMAQVASLTPSGSPNRLRVTVTTPDTSVGAADYSAIETKIEGLRMADLRSGSITAKTITLRFGVRAPAGIYSVALRNAANNRAYAAEYVIAAGEANTDVVKSVTIPLDQTGTWLADTGAGLDILWCLMVGTTYSTPAGSWVAGNFLGSTNQFNFMGTNGNVFEFFDVGLYEGTVALPFVVPDPVTETILCKRYYQKLELNMMGWYSYVAGGALYTAIPFETEMRISPSIATLQTPTATNASPVATIYNSSKKFLRIDMGSPAIGQSLCYSGIYALNARM